MKGRSTSSPKPRPESRTTSKPISASKTLLNDHYIDRITIDPSAGLGSFYDARTECVLGKLPLGKTPIIKAKQHEKVDCFIMKDDTFDTENLFRKIGIHDEPWLNSILNTIPSHGIASVVNYSFPKTTNTRFLYYYYSSQEQSISHEQNVVRRCILKDIPDITATHVISAKRVGIQALIVLRLSPNDETGLDCLLENITQQLIQNKFELRREEKSLSERIIVTKIFSNIPDLNKMSTFTGVCLKITAMKPHVYQHYPIEFTLRTIQWFYPLYPMKKAKYIPVEPEIVKKIKNHLLSLSSQIQELKISLDLRDNETRKKHLNEQYDVCRQQIEDVEKMYSVEIERIRDLVIKIRSGTMKQEPIDEILINRTEQSLQSNINLIESRLQALREKEQLINKSDKQNIKYVNKHQHPLQQPISTNGQAKPLKLLAPSTSQVTLDPNGQLKEIAAPFYLSLPSNQLPVENALSRTDSLRGVEQPSNLSAKPTSQPSQWDEKLSTEIEQKTHSPRSGKISTKDSVAPSNKTIIHRKGHYNESKPSIMSGPPVIPRSQRQGSNSDEPIRPTTPLKLSAATHISRPEARSNCSDEYDNGSEASSPLISDATHPSKQHPVNNQEQAESSKLPTSPGKLSPKIEKTVSRTTSPNRSVTERKSSPEKQRIQVEDQQTPPKSPTLAMSNYSLASSQQTEGDREASDVSIPPTQLNIENTLPRGEQLVSLEASTTQPRLSRPSTSQSPSVLKRRGSTKIEHQPNTTESSNSSTTKSARMWDQQTNNREELSNISNSPKTSTSQLTPPIERRGINDKAPFKSPSVKRMYPSKEQSDRPDDHDNVLKPSPLLALHSIQPLKKQPEDNKQQTKSSISPVSSTPETIQSSKKQSENIRESFSPSTSPNLLDAEEIFSEDKLHGHSNEQHRSRPSSVRSISDISLAVNQKSEDNNSSFSSKQPDVGNTTAETSELACVEDSTKRSKLSTVSTRKSPSRERRRDIKTNNQLNTTLPSNKQINNEKELSSMLFSPTIVSPQTASRTIHKSKNIEEPVKTSTMQRTSSSIELSNGANDHIFSSKSLPILSAETSQRTEKQSEDIEKQFNQLESRKSSSTKHTSSSKQQPNDVKQERDTQKSQRPATPNPTLTEKRPGSSTRSSPNKYINILLLGESGVGKSTFINALLNYHAFNTFEEARSNQPFVAMPVSFLMTVGDQFEEKIVRFGGVDPNEDHDHPGQSVTQHCRSYVIQIGTQTKLRIIDTPGMGDTRGLEQDDRNMQHIVSFINNLSHLNAICILLKPNESRLTIVLRSYFTRLLNFLGENARNNLVFCFTNTRATFFAPGNTGPLLRKMIDGLPIKGIPFAKTNTFCFDSEAFRYLVALQNGIKFDTYQEKEYQESWTSSSTVSNRFLQYICAELEPYSQKKWQSIEHAQFQINQLIRPMLETMRNLFRNITLLKEKPSKPLIKLCPIVLSRPATICYTCPRVPKRFRDFWILSDDLHTFADKCNDCDHSKKKHIDVNYKLEYELIQSEGTESFDKMNSNLYQLRMAILEFSQFYGYVVDTLKQNDPMLSTLKQIIAEENQICSKKDSTCLNSTLMDIFLTIKKEYQDRRTTTISIHVPVDLPSLYKLIQNISKMDEISEQMHAIKKAQKRYLKQHEKQVS